jgi:hypothetical protein
MSATGLGCVRFGLQNFASVCVSGQPVHPSKRTPCADRSDHGMLFTSALVGSAVSCASAGSATKTGAEIAPWLSTATLVRRWRVRVGAGGSHEATGSDSRHVRGRRGSSMARRRRLPSRDCIARRGSAAAGGGELTRSK